MNQNHIENKSLWIQLIYQSMNGADRLCIASAEYF